MLYCTNTNFFFFLLNTLLTLNVPIPDKVKKLSQIFIFTLLCGASKGFMNGSLRVKVVKKLRSVNHTIYYISFCLQKNIGHYEIQYIYDSFSSFLSVYQSL